MLLRWGAGHVRYTLPQGRRAVLKYDVRSWFSPSKSLLASEPMPLEVNSTGESTLEAEFTVPARKGSPLVSLSAAMREDGSELPIVKDCRAWEVQGTGQESRDPAQRPDSREKAITVRRNLVIKGQVGLDIPPRRLLLPEPSSTYAQRVFPGLF